MRLDPVLRKPGLPLPDLQEYCATLRPSDAKSQLQVAARRDKGGNPSGKLCRLMPRVSRMAVRLIDLATAAPIFALNPADAHVATWVQAKIAKQTEDKHSITQHRHIPSAASAAGSISINEMSNMSPPQILAKTPVSGSRVFARDAEKRANKRGCPRQYGQNERSDIDNSL